MAGQASPGVTLTPNRNVNAPAGAGGDKWGAYGGGITAIGAGVTGPTGWDERVGCTLSNGQSAENYQLRNLVPMEGGESTGALTTDAHDDSLPSGNSNAG